MAFFDWMLLAAFLVALLFVVLRSRRSSGSVSDYFLANRSLHTWLVVASVLATEVSAATVVAGPDTSFNTSLAFVQTTIGTVLSRFVLAYFFIEAYYKAGVTTVYEFLATRFGRNAQRMSAGLFCFARLAASGARLYIAALAIATVVGAHYSVIIAALGTLALGYSLFGGLRSVVLTDVLQGLAFLLFGCFVLLMVLDQAGGALQVWHAAIAAGKLELFVWGGSVFSAGFWRDPYTVCAGLLGGFFLGLATHGTDQDMVQRILASRKSRGARQSLIAVGLCEIPVTLLFVGIGVALWVLFQKQGIAVPHGTSVLPYFVQHYVGTGLRGLFVVAVSAAALSSLDSVINALASVTYCDLSRSRASEEMNLRRAHRMSFFWALALCLIALALGAYHQHYLLTLEASSARNAELLSLALGVMSTLYGPLLGIFSVAVLTRTRGSERSALFALAAALILTIGLQALFQDVIGWTWRIVIGSLVSFTVCAAVPTNSNLDAPVALKDAE